MERAPLAAAVSTCGRATEVALRLAAALLLVSSSHAAFASDGVIEINEARAAAGGVTPGDAPGYPVTISESGSFRLTGNLIVPSESTAISIVALNVSLDLGGFSVAGPNSCSGYPTTACTSTGGNAGIVANGNAHHARVANGVVRNFNGNGVWLQGASSAAEDLRVHTNGDMGIVVAGSGRVIRCISLVNHGSGISVGSDGLVESSEARANGYHGIHVVGGIVINSTSLSNLVWGFYVPNGGRVQGNQARLNGEGFIFGGSKGIASENVAYQNGGTGVAGAGWLVSKNVAVGNVNDFVSGISLGDNVCGSDRC